jgi:hypothetical protein
MIRLKPNYGSTPDFVFCEFRTVPFASMRLPAVRPQPVRPSLAF